MYVYAKFLFAVHNDGNWPQIVSFFSSPSHFDIYLKVGQCLKCYSTSRVLDKNLMHKRKYLGGSNK